MVRKSCLFGLLSVAMIAPLQADVVKINAQNCADFANAFITSHPVVGNGAIPGGRCFANASDFALAIKLAEAERPRRRVSSFCAKAGAVVTGFHAAQAVALLCGLVFFGFEANTLRGLSEEDLSTFPSFFREMIQQNPIAKRYYWRGFVPLVGGAVAVLGGSTYGLVKLSRWFNQTPLSRVVITANPYSLCKDVLMDQNVANVLTNEQLCELMTLLSKIK